MARYRVTHAPHFINSIMVYPDRGDESIVTLPKGTKPGRWLELVKEGGKKKDEPEDDAPAYAPKHRGGGKWAVVDADGEWFSDYTGESKEEAQEEADRLIAGGDPVVAEQDDDNE